MNIRLPLSLPLAALLAGLAGCATSPRAADAPPVDVAGAEVATHTAANGDVISEYRVGSQLKLIKVQPPSGPAYYLYDKNGDGKLDDKQMPQTHWRIFSW